MGNNNNDDFDDKKQNNNDPNKKRPLEPTQFSNKWAFISLILVLIILLSFFMVMQRNGGEEKSFSEFMQLLEEDRISKDPKYPLIISPTRRISGYYFDQSDKFTPFSTINPFPNDNNALIEKLEATKTPYKGEIKGISLFDIIINFSPIILVILFIWFMFRQVQGNGNRALSFGKSRAKRFKEMTEKVTFSDVAGADEAKEELSEVIQFLKNTKNFIRIGAKIPKGVLLVGPPGTGKTLMAKAIAGEAGVAFFHMSGSDFVEMFVGVGASRVRDLFDQGRKNAPCILFIDELDAVGRVRGAGYGGGHDEREQTLNQMLVEMDGFDTTKGVIIIAATNRPDVLDPALLRPGRFDRQIVVDLPDVKGREAILKIHAKKVAMSKDVDLQKIAKVSPGFTGADLANMVNEAAILAARRNKKKVSKDDFEEARDKVMMGVARKSKFIPPKEKKSTAYHEAGHALLNIYLENTDPMHKVTIIPRGRALGITWSMPENDILTRTKEWAEETICKALGGRVAEELVFSEISSGAVGDIEHVTKIARAMVCEWGMSERLGMVQYGQKEEPIFIGKEIARHKDYSELTAQLIDSEIKDIVDRNYNRAKKLIGENKDKLDQIASALMERETLDREEVEELIGYERAVKEEETTAEKPKPKKTDQEQS